MDHSSDTFDEEEDAAEEDTSSNSAPGPLALQVKDIDNRRYGFLNKRPMAVMNSGSSLRLGSHSVLVKTLGRKSGYRAKYGDFYTIQIHFRQTKSVMMNA